MCKYELPTNIKAFESDRLTDRQTRSKLYTTPLRGWSVSVITGSLRIPANKRQRGYRKSGNTVGPTYYSY